MSQDEIRVNVELASLSSMRDRVDTFDDLVLWAKEVRDSVPKEFRAKAVLSIDRDYETGWEIEAFYYRPKTEADRQKEERDRREWEAQRHSQEYDMYQRLKAKYEGSEK